MKNKLMACVLCLGIGFSGPALAAGGPFYLGLKVGSMMVDVSGFDDASAVGFVAGYKFFDNAGGSVAIEGEYNDSSSADIKGFPAKWDIRTVAVYLAYRSAGDLYFKGKAGYLDEKVTASGFGTTISGSDSGLSVGVGGGWKMGKQAALELEFTIIEEDVNYLSLGVIFSF